LDPFLGSGTTVKAALDLARNAVGYEINPDFLEAMPQKIGGNDRLPFYSEIQLIKTDKRIEELPEIDYTPAIRNAVDLPQARFIQAKTATLHKVTEIIDAQTIRLDNGHRVKFLGVRVDRRVEALEYLRHRILGKQVLLKDNGSNDQEIISAYVYLKNKIFINAYLIKSGMASPDVAVNHKLNKKFIQLQEQRGKIKPAKAQKGE
jgi:modification methylase